MLQQIGFSGCDLVVSFLDQSTMSFLYPSFASALRIQATSQMIIKVLITAGLIQKV